MAHIQCLPREVLLYVFKFYLETESQADFITCISNVCDEWRTISTDVSLWRKFDGTLTENYLLQYSKRGQLLQTEELIYSRSNKLLKQSKREKIFAGLTKLKSINFSNVKHLDDFTFSCMTKYCKNLNEIKFSRNINIPEYTVSLKLLETFFMLSGFNLKVLDLSNCTFKDFKTLVTTIAEFCKNLEELMIQNIKSGLNCLFPLDMFQINCQKIKVLRLGLPIHFSKYKNMNLPGFPLLEIFTHPSSEDISFSDINLSNILFNSPNLKVLDIRGCRYLSVEGLLSIPATHLENFYISNTRLYLTRKFIEIITRWIRSLHVLDISKMKCDYINDTLVTLISKERMINLEQLDLSYTKVTASTVIKIIENCKKLTILNLTCCRNVGRGKMREHRGKAALGQLLQNLLYDEDTE